MNRTFVAPATTIVSGPNALRGEMLLVRHKGFMASAIRWAERRRRPRGVTKDVWLRCCRFNHVAWVVDDNIVVQEAGRGAEHTTLAEVLSGAEEVVIVRWVTTRAQLDAAIAFQEWLVGTGYGFLQIPADLVNALTGIELTLGLGVAMVCSTACCLSAERLGLIPDRPAQAVTPAHMALYSGAGISEEVPHAA